MTKLSGGRSRGRQQAPAGHGVSAAELFWRDSTRKRPADVRLHLLLCKAEVEALQSQIYDLCAQLKTYESLRKSNRKSLPRTSLESLPRTLVEARIATGISQAELAERLGMKPQQIQRYEATSYSSASLSRVQQVARALGLKLEAQPILT